MSIPSDEILAPNRLVSRSSSVMVGVALAAELVSTAWALRGARCEVTETELSLTEV